MTHSDEIKEVCFGTNWLPGNLSFAIYLTDGASGRITGPGGKFGLDGVEQFINIMFVPSGFQLRFVEIEKSSI